MRKVKETCLWGLLFVVTTTIYNIVQDHFRATFIRNVVLSAMDEANDAAASKIIDECRGKL